MWQAGHQDVAQRQQQQVEQLLRLQNEQQQQQRILELLSSAFARPGSGFPVSFPVGLPSDLTSLAFSTAMPQFNPFSLLAAAGAHLPTMMHQQQQQLQQQQQQVLSTSTTPPFGLPAGAHSENASISSGTSANRTPELSWWALKYLSSQADGDGERGAPSVGSASSSDRNEWRPATHGAARAHAEDADTTLDESIPEDDARASGVAQGRPWQRGRHGEAPEQRSAAQKPPPYAEDRPIRPGVVGRRTTFEEFVEEQLKLQEARGAAHKANSVEAPVHTTKSFLKKGEGTQRFARARHGTAATAAFSSPAPGPGPSRRCPRAPRLSPAGAGPAPAARTQGRRALPEVQGVSRVGQKLRLLSQRSGGAGAIPRLPSGAGVNAGGAAAASAGPATVDASAERAGASRSTALERFPAPSPGGGVGGDGSVPRLVSRFESMLEDGAPPASDDRGPDDASKRAARRDVNGNLDQGGSSGGGNGAGEPAAGARPEVAAAESVRQGGGDEGTDDDDDVDDDDEVEEEEEEKEGKEEHEHSDCSQKTYRVGASVAYKRLDDRIVHVPVVPGDVSARHNAGATTTAKPGCDDAVAAAPREVRPVPGWAQSRATRPPTLARAWGAGRSRDEEDDGDQDYASDAPSEADAAAAAPPAERRRAKRPTAKPGRARQRWPTPGKQDSGGGEVESARPSLAPARDGTEPAGGTGGLRRAGDAGRGPPAEGGDPRGPPHGDPRIGRPATTTNPAVADRTSGGDDASAGNSKPHSSGESVKSRVGQEGAYGLVDRRDLKLPASALEGAGSSHGGPGAPGGPASQEEQRSAEWEEIQRLKRQLWELQQAVKKKERHWEGPKAELHRGARALSPHQEAARHVDKTTAGPGMELHRGARPFSPHQEAARHVDKTTAGPGMELHRGARPFSPHQETARHVDKTTAGPAMELHRGARPFSPHQEAARHVDKTTAGPGMELHRGARPFSPHQEAARHVDVTTSGPGMELHRGVQPLSPRLETARHVDKMRAGPGTELRHGTLPTAATRPRLLYKEEPSDGAAALAPRWPTARSKTPTLPRPPVPADGPDVDAAPRGGGRAADWRGPVPASVDRRGEQLPPTRGNSFAGGPRSLSEPAHAADPPPGAESRPKTPVRATRPGHDLFYRDAEPGFDPGPFSGRGHRSKTPNPSAGGGRRAADAVPRSKTPNPEAPSARLRGEAAASSRHNGLGGGPSRAGGAHRPGGAPAPDRASPVPEWHRPAAGPHGDPELAWRRSGAVPSPTAVTFAPDRARRSKTPNPGGEARAAPGVGARGPSPGPRVTGPRTPVPAAPTGTTVAAGAQRARTPLELMASPAHRLESPHLGGVGFHDDREADDDIQQEILYPDGKVEMVLRSGRRMVQFRNGTRKEVSADGHTVTVAFPNGDVKKTTDDQRVVYYYAESRVTHTTYPDGTQHVRFPSGQTETQHVDGRKEIVFPDGMERLIHRDGHEESRYPDGTRVRTARNGEKVIEFANGQREVHTAQYKRREYPDGMVTTLWAGGRQETRYPTGLVRVRDRGGGGASAASPAPSTHAAPPASPARGLQPRGRPTSPRAYPGLGGGGGGGARRV
ncbi:uncharacterized protein LOC144735803 [Lampetra planeri]